MAPTDKLNPSRFYGQWAGHPLSDLSALHALALLSRPHTPNIYLAGDSSLDNKAWVPSPGPGGDPLPVAIPEIYNSFLHPSQPKPDIAFWLNHVLGHRATVINAAVEASLLRDRDDALLPHDEFIRSHIRASDVLVVSIGANDIVLRPNASTMRHMFQLAWLTSRRSIEAGTASSLAYFGRLFRDQTQAYVERVVAKTRPRVVVVCMIYFPLEVEASRQSSWADGQLKMLGYDRDPGQLQAAIKKMFEQATCEVRVEGVEVVPCALFDVMDGKDERDYTARVEPSVEGGRKMAELLEKCLRGHLVDGE